MPAGTCDPASRGDTWNAIDLQQGPILVNVEYGWDGASVRPDCDGPLNTVRVRNTGTETWYLRLPRKKQGQKNIPIPPDTDQTFTPQQLSQIGLDTRQDVSGLALSIEP